MLILHRRIDQRIFCDVPDDKGGTTRIVITLIDTGHNRAGIGIDAPRNVTVLREELDGTSDRPRGKSKN